MTLPTFNQPEDNTYFKPAGHSGHLVAYLPNHYEPAITTNFTKPGETVEAITATVICVDCELEWGSVQEVRKRIVGVTKDRIGEVVLGRLAQKEGKPGSQPAWILDTFSDADGQRATTYWQKRTAGAFPQPTGSTHTGTSQPVANDNVQGQQVAGHQADIDALKSQLGAEVL